LFDKLTQMDNLGSKKEVKYNAVSWADGAVMRKKNSSLRYYVGLITSGFVQFDISGLDPATAISRMLFTMWDGNFPADSQNPWLARIQQHSPISTRTKNYLRVRWLQEFLTPDAERFDEASSFLEWKNPSTVRIEWTSNLVKLFVDNKLQFQFAKKWSYMPERHMIELGGQYRGEAAIGAVYTNLKVGVIEGGVTDPPPRPPTTKYIDWETFQWTKLGFKSALRLHNTDMFWAVKAIDDSLIWDGMRNPQTALRYEWKSFNGLKRSEVENIVERSARAIDLLRSTFRWEKTDWWLPTGNPADGRANHKYVGGTAIDGTLSLKQYDVTMRKIIVAANGSAKLNGISAISKGDNTGFTF
jgi:hypothetical protein